MSTTDPTITIPMTGRRPVRASKADWPVVARGNAHDPPGHECQANTIWIVRVREHADGRRIVYGRQDEGPGGQLAGVVNPYAGYMVAPVDGAPDDAATVDAVLRVCRTIGAEHLAQYTLADLRPEDV